MSTVTGSIGSVLAVAARVSGAAGAELPRSAFISGTDLGLMAAACVALLGAALAPGRGCDDSTRDHRPYAARSDAEFDRGKHGTAQTPRAEVTSEA